MFAPFSKTRVALQFADMAREFADMSVFWVYAHNVERLRKTFDDIAKEVDIPGHQDPKADTLQLVKKWLESDASGRWLLIVDNLDDTELLYPSKSHCVRYAEYLPRSETGSILLTTRNGRVGHEFAAARNVLTLAGMDPEESVALLSNRLGNNQSNESLKELAEELGQVPLALVQAASFINQNRESVGRYLQLYRQSDSAKIQLLSDNFEDEVRHGPSKNPIATTWCVSFEYIEEHDPQAAALLSFISMLANDGVPRFLLPQGADEVKFDKAIGTLQAFSFISPRYTEIKDAQHQLFDFHRLVRVAMRNWLVMNRKFDTWTASAIEELAAVVDRPDLKRYEFSSQCMPHTTELLAVERLQGASGPQHVPAIFLKHKRKKRVCRLLFNLLRRKRKEQCVHNGSICPLCTQRILSFVGRSLLSVGDDSSAMPFMQRNLAICTHIFGDAHPNSLESLFSLVFINRKLLEFETAEILCRKLIEDSKPKSGPVGIRTMDGRELLVEILSDRGKDAEAEAVEEELMETCHREMNEMNSCVNLNRLRILAKIFESRGEYNEAAEYQLRVVQGYKATMGLQNLYTIQALNRLALIYFDLERYNEAEDYARLAFDSSEILWGLNNTYTINYMLQLSRILRWQSKIKEADDLADSALRLSAETFGDTHPRYLQHSMVHRDSLKGYEEMTNSTLRVGDVLS